MPYADNNGVRTHYQIEGDGPPLVLQHGFTSSLKRWYMHGSDFGMAKYTPERVHALIIGGSDPYKRIVPAASRLDGSDPDAFLNALFGRLRVGQASMPPEIRDEILANDFQALASAQQDRPSIADILSTMAMPCLLYAGEPDPIFSKTQESAKHIPHAIFFRYQTSTTQPCSEHLTSSYPM